MRTEADLPVLTYKLQTRLPSQLLEEEAAYEAFAKEVAQDGAELLSKYEIEDVATRISVLDTLSSLAIVRGDRDSAMAYINEIRTLQPKPASKLTYGIRQEAALAAGAAGTSESSRVAAFRSKLSEKITALPWELSEPTVKAWKGAADVANPNFLHGLIQAEQDPLYLASGSLDWSGAQAVIGTHLVLHVMLPYKAPMIEVLSEYIASHQQAQTDIWAGRVVSLEGRTGLEPVTIAIWDTGTDTTLFKGKLFKNPGEIPGNEIDDDHNGYVDDENGIAFGLYLRNRERALLYPLNETERASERELRLMYEGHNDVSAGLDTAAAQHARKRLSSIKPEEMGPLIESVTRYMYYSHGTHVAGIAADGNPAARLLIVRTDDPYQVVPPPFTREVAQRYAKYYPEVIAYFKAHHVCVANMSWIVTAAAIEQTLEANGIGESPESRKAKAAASFKLVADALTEAIRSAPDILFVPGSGNSNDDVSFLQAVPAGIELPNVLTAGAVNQAGKEAAFTSYGATVRIHANGVQVSSYVPGGLTMPMSGTSMAAPQVVNLAAKILAVKPDLSPPEVIELILAGADPSPDQRLHLMNPKKTMGLLK